MVELKEIKKNNYNDCLKLQVAENQKNFVESNLYSMTRAWTFFDKAFPFAIYAGDRMVGFVMMAYYKPKDIYNIWQLMIDKHYQGKGYGIEALLLVINHLIEKHNTPEIYLAYEPNNSVAENLYSSVGFKRTGEIENSEIVMCLNTQ